MQFRVKNNLGKFCIAGFWAINPCEKQPLQIFSCRILDSTKISARKGYFKVDLF